MKKIVFLGDSITDMKRAREETNTPSSYGFSFVFFSEGYLSTNYPRKYQLINKAISGSRIVDVYSRIKIDLWNEKPDYVTLLIGINDIWHELFNNNGVDLERFYNILNMIIDETKQRLPETKFIIIEPFFLPGFETNENINFFKQIYSYSQKIKEICQAKNIPFIPIQAKFNELALANGPEYYLYDGVHPSVCGSKVISDSWLEVFLDLER